MGKISAIVPKLDYASCPPSSRWAQGFGVTGITVGVIALLLIPTLWLDFQHTLSTVPPGRDLDDIGASGAEAWPVIPILVSWSGFVPSAVALGTGERRLGWIGLLANLSVTFFFAAVLAWAS